MSDPTEKPAGAAQCLGGAVHVYRSGEGDRWARLCMVVAGSTSGGTSVIASSGRADVLLSPGQAVGVASAMEKDDPDFLHIGRGTLWCRRHHSAPALGFAVLGAECAFGNGPKEVCVTSEHLRQIAAALRAASSPPAGAPDGARRRTDDNLRGVFGGGR